MNQDWSTLRAWALELGFSEVGCCSAEAFRKAQQMVEEQEPLAERRQLRFDPQQDDPRIRSLAVLLWAYAPAEMPSGETLFIDSYYDASNAAYHATNALEKRLLEAGYFAKANVPYPAKEAAIRAGLGVIGKNSLLVTPKSGTRVVIILMATDFDIPVEYGGMDNHLASACEGCQRCQMACPSGALTEHGMEHPEKCLRNFMMEGIVIPPHVRPKIGMRLIGCDICQRVCPMQPKFQPTQQQEAVALASLMTLDKTAYSQAIAKLASRIGRNTARPQRVRAQAAILAGNSKNRDYLPVLRAWTEEPFEAVATHARWAIEQIEPLGGGEPPTTGT